MTSSRQHVFCVLESALLFNLIVVFVVTFAGKLFKFVFLLKNDLKRLSPIEDSLTLVCVYARL